MVLTHGSDNLRAWRQQEEPSLTFALWQQTPAALRWTLSRETLQHILSLAQDADSRKWAQEQLDLRFSGSQRDWKNIGRRKTPSKLHKKQATQHAPTYTGATSSSWSEPQQDQWWQPWANMAWGNRGGW